MKATDFLNKAEKTEKRIFFLYGKEDYLLSRCEAAILDRYLPDMRDLNVDRISGGATIEDFIAKAEQNPCFAEARVIIAEDWSMIKSGDTKKLQEYLSHPNPAAVMLFKQSDKPDSRRAIVKYLNKNAEVIDAETPGSEELTKWIMKKSKKEGFEMEERAARLLCEVSGQDMFTLLKELDKLRYLKKDRIGEEDVMETASHTPEYNAFLLHDYMMKGDRKAAFKLLEEIFAAEKSYIPLISLFANKFRLLYCAKNHSSKPMSVAKSEVVSELKVHPYAAQIALKECAKFSRAHLRDALRIIAEYDAKVKTGGADVGLPAVLAEMYSDE